MDTLSTILACVLVGMAALLLWQLWADIQKARAREARFMALEKHFADRAEAATTKEAE